MSIYEANGYDDRNDYLKNLAADFGLEMDVVQDLADILGETEDFDGLPSTIEDYIYEGII